MKRSLTFLIIFLLLTAFPVKGQEEAGDFTDMNSLVTTLYHVISGPAGERDWDLFRSLFSENAVMGHTQMSPGGDRTFKFFEPEDYIAKNGPFFMTHSFHEEELKRATQVYGGIAQVFSSYEFELEENGKKIKQRGVNSIQLVFDQGRWYITQLVFEPETPGNPLPAELSGSANGQTAGMTEPTRIYFVRHAEKRNDGSKDPELTEEGKASAKRLADYLSDKGIVQVYSTGYNRTLNTAQPVSEKIGIETRTYDPRDPNALLEMIRNNQGETILIVGHSNTVPMMINYLAKEARVEPLTEDQYGQLFLVEYSDHTFDLEELSF